jgi:hypothetical protein
MWGASEPISDLLVGEPVRSFSCACLLCLLAVPACCPRSFSCVFLLSAFLLSAMLPPRLRLETWTP